MWASCYLSGYINFNLFGKKVIQSLSKCEARAKEIPGIWMKKMHTCLMQGWWRKIYFIYIIVLLYMSLASPLKISMNTNFSIYEHLIQSVYFIIGAASTTTFSMILVFKTHSIVSHAT